MSSSNGIGGHRAPAQSCKHSICGHCGKPISGKIGALALSAVCSAACQAASGAACSCKCNGEFHQGANSKRLQRILNPELQRQSSKRAAGKIRETKNRQRIARFNAETIEDYLALFIMGTRFNTASFDRFSDRNHRAGSNLALNWLQKSGGLGIDQLAKSFNDYHQFGLDEQQTTQLIVDFINENPGGIGPYIKRREVEKNQDLQPYPSYYSSQPAEVEAAPAKTPHLTPFDDGYIGRRPRA